ncbi:hypothetical protein [Pseudothioclava arenosa]|nr:hypothetical protein [Pseudothioclava arenosa]
MSPELRVLTVLAVATVLLAALGAGIFVLARGQMAQDAAPAVIAPEDR